MHVVCASESGDRGEALWHRGGLSQLDGGCRTGVLLVPFSHFGTHDARRGGMSSEPLGRKRWAIAEGYIPDRSIGPEPELLSHETVCLLNAGDRDAHVRITIFFSDREPAGPYEVTVGARRTRHVRFNDLREPERIPKATDYASVIESDVPIVVQHSRLDSRQSANALLSTIAYASD